MSHTYRISPRGPSPLAAVNNVNVYSSPIAATNGDDEIRRRRNSGSVQRPPSILSGLRNLMSRPRSESLNAQLMRKPQKLMKVQVTACQLESVYDLREGEGENADLYDDELAFRRPRSNSSDFLILRKTSRPLSVDVVGLVDSHSDPYRQYMKVVDCYELAPVAGNIIAVDKSMPIDKAFGALCVNNVGAALIWDANEHRLVSIVTFTDFLRILASDEDRLTEPVSSIMAKTKLVTLAANNKVFEACETFCLNKIHRIIVTEPGSDDVLYLLTLKRILQAIHKQNRSLHFAQWLSCPISDSEIGTWDKNIHTCYTTDTVLQAVTTILNNNVSCIPILDENGAAVDILLKSDLAHALWAAPNKNDIKKILSATVSSVLGKRPAVAFLQRSDSVGKVLDALLLTTHTRCIFICNESGSPIASISQTDVISHLIHDESPFQSRNHSRAPPTA